MPARSTAVRLPRAARMAVCADPSPAMIPSLAAIRRLFVPFLLSIAGAQAQVNVLTYHNDISRTGQNLNETVLTTSNVKSTTFGKIFTRAVDDQLYAQPLYVSGVNIPGQGTHNVVYLATTNDTVYAYDADDPYATRPLWMVTFLVNGAVPPTHADLSSVGACGSNYNDFSGNMGIVGTPVIDNTPFPGAAAGDQGTIYLVARTKENGSFFQRLHALNLRDGSERPNSPVTITGSVAGTGDGSSGGVITFDPLRQNERASLLLSNGVVYIAWASHCDLGPYHGWIMGYDATSLSQVVVYNTSPSGSEVGLWMGGEGPAADSAGNLYVSTGNGTVGVGSNPNDTTNRGVSFLKLTRSNSTLNVSSWFTPYNYATLNSQDTDLGSSGMLLMPNTTPALAISAGKQGRMYVVNRDNMGGLTSSTSTDDNIVQSLDIKLNNKIMGSPVYWMGPGNTQRVYIWCAADTLKAFTFNGTNFSTTPVQSTPTAQNPGGFMSISANGSNSGTGILWANVPGSNANQAVVSGTLYAFNAENVSQELWDSTQNSARDGFGNFAKFNQPIIANGKVYHPTFSNQLVVYGLIPASVTPNPPSALLATAVSHTQINLLWTDGSTNETGFRIERSTDGINYTEIGTVGANVTTYQDIGLAPFTTYYYRVRSYIVSSSPAPAGTVGASSYATSSSVTTNVGTPTSDLVVQGNSVTIANGDATPSTVDGTNFGTLLVGSSPIVTTFTLKNLGNAALNLTGSPAVQISGTNASDFSISAAAGNPVAVGSSTTFNAQFSPASTGVKNATISIPSNDPLNPNYTFAIQGTGTAQNLAGWWKFDETSGTTAADSSGNANTGTLNAPVATWSPTGGQLGGALVFSGTAGQSVSVPNNAALNPTSGISITAWINPTTWGTNNNRRILEKGGNDTQYRLTAQSNALMFDLSGLKNITTTLPATGTWTHVAGTYDGTTMRLYINGSQVTSVAITGSIATTTDALYIGTKNGTTTVAGDYFSGAIDDVRIYGRALAASEVADLASETGVVTITASDSTGQKATTDTASFTFTRTGVTTNSLDVNYSILAGAGQAVYRTDYGLSAVPPTFTIPAGQASAVLTVNPIYLDTPTGTLPVTLNLSSGSGYAVGSSASATVYIKDSPINIWKIQKFGSLAAAQSSVAGDYADPNGNGLYNLVDFALGHEPLAVDSKPLPVPNIEQMVVAGVAGPHLTLTFTRPHPAPSGITYIIESTDDLTLTENWVSASIVSGYPIDNGDGTETVKAAELNQAGQEGYIRLRVTRP